MFSHITFRRQCLTMALTMCQKHNITYRCQWMNSPYSLKTFINTINSPIFYFCLVVYYLVAYFSCSKKINKNTHTHLSLLICPHFQVQAIVTEDYLSFSAIYQWKFPKFQQPMHNLRNHAGQIVGVKIIDDFRRKIEMYHSEA